MPHALNKRAIKMRKPGDDAEITPDQRLIAAAPEMLTALQSLVAQAERHEAEGVWWDEARAVISKAKGVQP